MSLIGLEIVFNWWQLKSNEEIIESSSCVEVHLKHHCVVVWFSLQISWNTRREGFILNCHDYSNIAIYKMPQYIWSRYWIQNLYQIYQTSIFQVYLVPVSLKSYLKVKRKCWHIYASATQSILRLLRPALCEGPFAPNRLYFSQHWESEAL